MPEPRVKVYEIVDRLAKAETAFASLSHLKLDYRRDASTDEIGGRLPYGVDPKSRDFFYTVHDKPVELFQYPFLYQVQYQRARTVCSVPLEYLSRMDSAPNSPVNFVFSIGRCGSTLLIRIMNAAGMATISEPDIFTQMARHEGRRISISERRDVIAASARCFASYCADGTVIKLRSVCNTIAVLVMSSVDASRCEFVLRNRRDWARSMIAAFGTDARVLAKQLGTAIVALDQLMERGYCTGPIWYEDIVQNTPDVLHRFWAGIGVQANCDILRVMAEDSQKGTRLAREMLSHRTVTEEALRHFDEAWREMRPEPLLKKHHLDDRL